jgi:hypothetical protein
MTHPNERVEVEARRQHLHAVVTKLHHKHEVVGGDPHLSWKVELQRSVAPAADNPQQRAVTNTELVDGM